MTSQTKMDFKTMLLFYPNIEQCSFQFFMDDKNKKDITKSKIAPIRLFIDDKTEDKAWNRLVEMNDAWCWIFFSVNWMEKWKRNKESVTTINAWVCECDWMDKKSQRDQIDKCPLKPSMVIESKHSLHMYRFAKNGTKEKWNKICRWLRNYFNWDPAIASDISRVLRFPWFYNCKPSKWEWDSDAPYLCKIVRAEWLYYTEEEMLNAYKDNRTLDEIKSEELFKKQLFGKKNIKKKKDDKDNPRFKINELDAMTMLSWVSWTKWVAWETITFKPMSWWCIRICCNWKETNWRLDPEWKIWSLCEWWPWRVRWIKRYERNMWVHLDFKELYRELIKAFPELKPDKQKKQIKRKQSILDIIAKEKNG